MCVCVFSSYNKGVVIHFQRNRIYTIYKSSEYKITFILKLLQDEIII